MPFRRLNPQLRPWAQALFNVATRFELSPRVTSTFRSLDEQRSLYERFLRGESRFPAAPPGMSRHNFGLAFDMQMNSTQGQDFIGRVWESWGGRWGGRFNDDIHFDTG